MSILFSVEYEGKDFKEIFDFDLEITAERVFEAVLEEENCPYEAGVSLTITGAEAIRELNRQYRNIDRPTDVLSFPVTAYPVPADFSCLDGMTAEAFDPDSGELLLGDIVICAEKVRDQAAEYGHTRMREFAFLFCHSMLHLLGYDHMEADEEKVMAEKQERILAGCGILRE